MASSVATTVHFSNAAVGRRKLIREGSPIWSVTHSGQRVLAAVSESKEVLLVFTDGKSACSVVQKDTGPSMFVFYDLQTKNKVKFDDMILYGFAASTYDTHNDVFSIGVIVSPATISDKMVRYAADAFVKLNSPHVFDAIYDEYKRELAARGNDIVATVNAFAQGDDRDLAIAQVEQYLELESNDGQRKEAASLGDSAYRVCRQYAGATSVLVLRRSSYGNPPNHIGYNGGGDAFGTQNPYRGGCTQEVVVHKSPGTQQVTLTVRAG